MNTTLPHDLTITFKRTRPSPDRLIATAPVTLSSRSHLGENRREREHRRVVQQGLTSLLLQNIGRPPGPWTVRLVRLYPAGLRPFRDDRLRSAFWFVQQSVADYLRVDAKDESYVTWEYAQERVTGSGIRIEITTRATIALVEPASPAHEGP